MTRVPRLGKVRLVISFQHDDLSGGYAVLVTNQRDWNTSRIIATYLLRWPTEIVQSQLTKGHLLTSGAGGDDVADLYLATVHDHAVDEQFDKVGALGEGGGRQGGLHAPVEVGDPARHRGGVVLLLGLRVHLAELQQKAV